MGHYREGIRLAEGALKIHELLGDTAEQTRCLMTLAALLHGDEQLDAAEEAASRAINIRAANLIALLPAYIISRARRRRKSTISK